MGRSGISSGRGEGDEGERARSAGEVEGALAIRWAR